MELISKVTETALPRPGETDRSSSSKRSENTHSLSEVVHQFESSRISISANTVPMRKAEAVRIMRRDGVMPSVGKFGNQILEYFQLIGADQSLPTETDDLRGYIMRWHCHLCLLNDLFPADMPFTFVYKRFFHAVVQGKVSMKGYNVRAQIAAFNEWWHIHGNYVREQYNRMHPETQPKQISNTKTPEQELAAAKRALTRMQELGFSDEAIKHQQQMVKKLEEG